MTISEVSQKYDISIDTLRYYERVGLIPPRKAILVEQREILAQHAKEILDTLDRLDKKIDGYEERVLKYEKKLK